FAIGADHTIVYRIDGGEGTVAHELVHVIVFNQLPTTPTWFEEALASNFEEYRIENGEIAGLFRLDHWRMNFMRENQQEAGPFDIDSLPPIGDIARRNQRLVMMFKEEAPVRETTFSFPELDQVTAKMFVMFLQEKGKLRSVVHALGHQDLESRFETQLTTIRESVGDDYERQWRIWLDRKLRQAGAKTIFTENRIRK
ncbi:MAG TPA: hypothetical protein QF564_12260, partial [Pirellulaceae bacterium]|nr:hypothetical protein [Pirellulaceae bacterium]